MVHLVRIVGGSSLGNCCEGLLNIFVFFGTSLEILQISVVLGPLLGLQLVDLPVLLLVDLVPDHDEGEVIGVLGGALEQEFLLP